MNTEYDYKEAMLYETLPDKHVRCELCNHHCDMGDGATGICGVRRNINGVLLSLSYSHLASWHVDPIEKKTLFHYRPGSTSFSMATVGCNFRCSFCQNWDLSQYPQHHKNKDLPGGAVTPEALAKEAQSQHCHSISFTYSEPTVFFELAYETALAAKPLGIDAIFVTNGFMSAKAIDTMKGLLVAANVDLKCFSEEQYKKVCGGRLQPVLDNIRHLRENGVWVEITTLVIPDFNDGEKELAAIAEFIASVDPGIPWHVSAFHPDYRMMDRPRTPYESLLAACRLGTDAGLHHIYTGNSPGGTHEHTACRSCKETLIRRSGFRVLDNRLTAQGTCPVCDTPFDGIL